MKLLIAAGAWVGGLLIGLSFHLPLLSLYLSLVTAASLVLLLRLTHRPAWVALAIAVLLLAVIRVEAPPPAPSLRASQGDMAVKVRGVVQSDPELKGRGVQLVLAVRGWDTGRGWEDVKDKLLVVGQPSPHMVTARDSPYFRYGDLLVLEGKLREPQAFGAFDYRDYLARQGIHFTMFYPKVALVAQGGGNPLLKYVYGLRHRLSEALGQSLPEPHAALAQALLLGQRSSLPADLNENFRDTGTTHILAISGQNVAILVAMSLGLSVVLLGRRRQLYLLAPLALIWLYALVSGMSPSVARATVMGTVYLAALALGRPGGVLPSLALAAAVMAGLQPSVLRDISFQLSFTAVAGIALLAKPIATWLQARSGNLLAGQGIVANLTRGLLLAISVSLAATLATLPLTAFNFHRFSTVGIPATILALPALAPILGLSALVALGALIHPAIGDLLGWLAWVPLSYFIEVVKLFALLPGIVVTIPRFSALLLWVYYGLFAVVLVAPGWLKAFGALFHRQEQRTPKQARPVAGWVLLPNKGLLSVGLGLFLVALFSWLAVLYSPDGKLHVFFLDVGQGDSMLIVTPKGRQVLIDGGADSYRAVQGVGRYVPFWDKSLDLVVLSHPDEDHLKGLPQVVSRYNVRAVLEGGAGSGSISYLEWQQVLQDRDMEPIKALRGERIDLKEPLQFEVLNPPSEAFVGTPADRNNNGVVMRLSYGSVSFLLTADIQVEAELALLRQGATVQSTVLKAAHHGSRTSTSPSFLAAVHPQAVVISVGANNTYGHPHTEVVSRLVQAVGKDGLYLTSQRGTVEFITDGRRLWVKTER